jgi:hypothetical protein
MNTWEWGVYAIGLASALLVPGVFRERHYRAGYRMALTHVERELRWNGIEGPAIGVVEKLREEVDGEWRS